MMSNPELRRNLWLTFSPARLLLMPLLLMVLFVLISYRADGALSGHWDHRNLAIAARCLFFAIMVVWGFTSAGSSITTEIQEGTWDQQRMSALSPWTLAWGKLFGSTAYAWYGGGICFGAFIIAAILDNRFFSSPFAIEAIVWITSALLGSALSMLLSFTGHAGQRAGLYGILSAILVSVPFFLFMVPELYERNVIWWSSRFSGHGFILISLCFFTAWAVFALWRVMLKTLQVRALPWAFPLFLVLLALYFTGFVARKNVVSFFPFCLGLIALAATYGIIVSHNSDERVEITWKRLTYAASTGKWRQFLETLPLWPVSGAVVLICIPASFILPRVSVAGMTFEAHYGVILLVGFFVALRDICVYLFLALSRHAGKKTAVVLAVYLLMIHLILPSFAFFLPALTAIIQPLSFREGEGFALAAAMGQLVVAMGMLFWKINQLDRTQDL